MAFISTRQQTPLFSSSGRIVRLDFRDLLICLTLAAVTIAIYGRSAFFGFVDYDDTHYVTNNPYLHLGLGWAGIKWALTTGYFSYWHPVTWLIYLTLESLFGIAAQPIHTVNFCLHACSACLFFIVLRKMTGSCWRAAIAAAIWAWHPLRVESVAWVSEVKDVAGVFFALLTLLAYVRYVRQPGVQRYAAVAIFCLLGLASKPTIVTLPFALLLLDFWPLNRAGFLRSDGGVDHAPVEEGDRDVVALKGMDRVAWLISEKLPLILMAMCVVVMTYYVQEANHALAAIPMGERWLNTPVALVKYLAKTFWPTRLTLYYPHPFYLAAPMSVVWVTACYVFIALSTYLAMRLYRVAPYLIFGWLWFLGTMMPTIGLIQAGDQAMADRYTYLSSLGLLPAIVWGGYAALKFLVGSWARVAGFAMAAAALGGLATAAFIQVGYWRDPAAAWGHAVEVTSHNFLAECGLAQSERVHQRLDLSLALAKAARADFPLWSRPYQEVGLALQAQGRLKEALKEFRVAIVTEPTKPEIRNDTGGVLVDLKRPKEAMAQFREAVRLDPSFVMARHNLAVLLMAEGKTAEAMQQWREALILKPRFGPGHGNLAMALRREGDWHGAIQHYRAAIAAGENDPDWQVDLVWLLATSPDASARDVDEAVELGRKVAGDQGKNNALAAGCPGGGTGAERAV